MTIPGFIDSANIIVPLEVIVMIAFYNKHSLTDSRCGLKDLVELVNMELLPKSVILGRVSVFVFEGPEVRTIFFTEPHSSQMVSWLASGENSSLNRC